jgi:very-short-patch-repair endonuclease
VAPLARPAARRGEVPAPGADRPFIADFACAAHRLVVELDGGQHAESALDRRRDAALAAQGWRVLRVWNAEVIENPNAVLYRIGQAIGVAWDPF